MQLQEAAEACRVLLNEQGEDALRQLPPDETPHGFKRGRELRTPPREPEAQGEWNILDRRVRGGGSPVEGPTPERSLESVHEGDSSANRSLGGCIGT